MGFDACGNHRTWCGKSTFDENGEFVSSNSIIFAGMALHRIVLDDDEETVIYKPSNYASSDGERPLLMTHGVEGNEKNAEIMAHFDKEAKVAHNTIFKVDYNSQEIQFKVKIKCCQLDGKTHKILQGRGGAWCLLCSTPKDFASNKKLIEEGFPMDVGLADLWENFYSVADQDYDGKYFIDKDKIPTHIRMGATAAPMAEELELGWFLPPLHCYLRFLAFFIEMAIRFRAENYLHGHITKKMKTKMAQAKKAFREEARTLLEKRYQFAGDGGSTDNGNAARHFFSHKMRQKVIQLFEMGEEFGESEDMDSSTVADSDSESEVSESDIPDLDLMDSLDLNNLDESVDDVLGSSQKGNAMTKRQRKVLPQLLQNVSVILRVLNSYEDVNVEEFEKLCKETNLILVDYFDFMNITPTVHAVLAHSPDIIRNNQGKGLNNLSEEGSEGSHKVMKHLREHGARKHSLELNLKDCFRKMFFGSDPIVRGMKRKIICSFCQEEGHSIKSCPALKEVDMNEDDILLESVTYPDLTAYDNLADPQALEEAHDLSGILEEEEMEQELADE